MAVDDAKNANNPSSPASSSPASQGGKAKGANNNEEESKSPAAARAAASSEIPPRKDEEVVVPRKDKDPPPPESGSAGPKSAGPRPPPAPKTSTSATTPTAKTSSSSTAPAAPRQSRRDRERELLLSAPKARVLQSRLTALDAAFAKAKLPHFQTEVHAALEWCKDFSHSSRGHVEGKEFYSEGLKADEFYGRIWQGGMGKAAEMQDAGLASVLITTLADLSMCGIIVGDGLVEDGKGDQKKEEEGKEQVRMFLWGVLHNGLLRGRSS